MTRTAPLDRSTTARTGGPPAAHWQRVDVVAAAVAAITVVVVRWWISRERRIFHMWPDEPGQLAIARFIGRGARWNMFEHSTWRPAYGSLVSLATWFTDDPVTVYRAAIGMNAVLGGISCVLLVVLGVRFTQLRGAWCAVLALVLCLAPAMVFTTNYVWSEALVQAGYLAYVVTALRFLDRPSLVRGALLVATAALGFGTHSRLLPLAVVAGVFIAFVMRRGDLDRRRGAGLLVALAASMVAVSRFSRVVVERVWEHPAPTNTAGAVLGRFDEPGAVAISAVGQIWYQLVATAGLAGLGAIALVRASRRSPEAEADVAAGVLPSVRDARALLAIVIPLVGLSMLFMSGFTRPDRIVYGRYSDPVMLPVVLIGLAVLVTASARRLLRDGACIVAALVVCGGVLWLTKDDVLGGNSLLRPMVLGLVAYLRRAPLDVLAVTLAAAAVTALVFAAALVPRTRARLALVSVLAVALFAVGYVRTRPVVDSALNSWSNASTLGEVRGVTLDDGVPVRLRIPDRDGTEQTDQRRSQLRQRRAVYEFFLPENPLFLDGALPAGESSPFVFAALDDPQLVGHAELVWRDPGASIGLWRQSAD